MNNHTVIGIDLAKTVFQVGVMAGGKVTSNKQVSRAALPAFAATQTPAAVAMDS